MTDNKTLYSATVDSITTMVNKVTGEEAQYVQTYDLLDLDPTFRVQVRLDRNNAPKEMVERFKLQMSQSEFPPIVVSRDKRIIDGNTRYRAKLGRDEVYMPAIIVPLSY